MDWNTALGLESLGLSSLPSLILHLIAATVLAAFVAHRPWRRFMPRASPPAEQTVQSQTLLAVAGALMVGVIGDSMARAFGLVGLGALIRFRSGIKDPRDATIMFVMIAIGMACGRGLLPLGLLAAGFSSAVLIVFDLVGARDAGVGDGDRVARPQGQGADTGAGASPALAPRRPAHRTHAPHMQRPRCGARKRIASG